MDNIENLIMENRKLIYSITNYFEGYKNKEDLFQAGVLGMISAYKNFDSNYNIKFTTYAYPYIVGEMKKLVREDRVVHVSRDLIKLNSRIDAARSMMEQKMMRSPTNSELSNFLGVEEYLITEAYNANCRVQSIDEPITIDSKEITLHEVIPDKQKDINTLIALKTEIEKLTEFEQNVLDQRYIQDKTQSEIANDLGITQVQVSRQVQKVLTKLKKKLV
ncbi:MAG: sigma-70 family RNA polymerase sigma factor [Bacilli bacterium]